MGAVTLVVSGLGAAVQILPALEYARYALRWVNAASPVGWGQAVPYPVHQALGWSAAGLLFAVLPGAHEEIVNPLIGVVPLTLAAIGLMARERRREAGLFAGIFTGAVLFSLARSIPFHGVLYAMVPGLEKARAPIMAMAIADVAVAVLAAFGMEALLHGGVAASRILKVLGAIAAFLFVVSVYPPAILQGVPHGAERAAAIALVTALLGVLLWGRQRGRVGKMAALCGVLALALIEIGNSTGYDYVHVDDKASVVRPRLYGGTDDLAKFLRERIGSSRMTYEYNDLLFNFGDWYGIASMAGFVPSAPEALYRLGPWNPRVLDLYGVRYYAARERPAAEAGREVFRGEGGLTVWERPAAFPRAWTVHRVTRAALGLPAVQRVLDPAIDLRETVITDRSPRVDTCTAAEPVEVRTPDEEHVQLSVELACAGVVVLSDNWFPGWRARVDGQPAEVFPANAAMRGVAIPGGAHRIEMEYRPAAVSVGMAVSGCVFLALGVMVCMKARSGP